MQAPLSNTCRHDGLLSDYESNCLYMPRVGRMQGDIVASSRAHSVGSHERHAIAYGATIRSIILSRPYLQYTFDDLKSQRIHEDGELRSNIKVEPIGGYRSVEEEVVETGAWSVSAGKGYWLQPRPGPRRGGCLFGFLLPIPHSPPSSSAKPSKEKKRKNKGRAAGMRVVLHMAAAWLFTPSSFHPCRPRGNWEDDGVENSEKITQAKKQSPLPPPLTTPALAVRKTRLPTTHFPFPSIPTRLLQSVQRPVKKPDLPL